MSEEYQDITKAVVVCDHEGCGWEQEVAPESMKEWHKKPCPKCGNGEIIDDNDLAQINLLLGLCLIQQGIDPDRKMKRGLMKVNSANNSVEFNTAD